MLLTEIMAFINRSFADCFNCQAIAEASVTQIKKMKAIRPAERALGVNRPDTSIIVFIELIIAWAC